MSISGLAPYGVPDLDWFGGMNDSGIAALHAALQGVEAKERFEASGAEYDPEFIPSDLAALFGRWSDVLSPATDHGGLVDDDISYVTPWGFDPAQTAAPVLLVHGRFDRIVPAAHSEWLARHLPLTELRLITAGGHISVLNSAVPALEWLRSSAP